METRELHNKGQSQSTAYGRNYSRVESSNTGSRHQEHTQIGRIQRQPNHVNGNYYRPTRRNFYEFEEENEICNTRSEINAIQTESRDYNTERTISPKRYDRRYSGN
jgi:hypothetical protein